VDILTSVEDVCPESHPYELFYKLAPGSFITCLCSDTVHVSPFGCYQYIVVEDR
jgi:hypothetical protein